MPVVNVLLQVVLGDDLLHVLPNLLSRCNRRAAPGLEAIAERMQITVRSDPRILVGVPGPAEAFLLIEYRKGLAGISGLEMVGRTDPSDAGADDYNIKIRFGSCWQLSVGSRLWQLLSPSCPVPYQ